MFAMSLVEATDYNTSYGILFCENDEVSENEIQQKIYEIKNALVEQCGSEWLVEEVISRLPKEWAVRLQENNEIIEI